MGKPGKHYILIDDICRELYNYNELLCVEKQVKGFER